MSESFNHSLNRFIQNMDSFREQNITVFISESFNHSLNQIIKKKFHLEHRSNWV